MSTKGYKWETLIWKIRKGQRNQGSGQKWFYLGECLLHREWKNGYRFL